MVDTLPQIQCDQFGHSRRTHQTAGRQPWTAAGGWRPGRASCFPPEPTASPAHAVKCCPHHSRLLCAWEATGHQWARRPLGFGMGSEGGRREGDTDSRSVPSSGDPLHVFPHSRGLGITVSPAWGHLAGFPDPA